jgi:hypothetical protein
VTDTIVATIYLAAAEDSTDPWHVLGHTYDARLAIAALADLALARRLVAAPGAADDSPAARVLEVVPGPAPAGALAAALAGLASTSKRRDIDRVVGLLRDLSPAIEADLLASSGFVAAGEKGRFRKRTALAVDGDARAAAQARIRDAAESAAAGAGGAAERALALVAMTGLSARRLSRLCGGARPARLDPFEPFDPASRGPDGRLLGDKPADLLTALVTVLAATHDTTNDYE